MAEQQCPCKQKLTEGEKGILNFGLSSEMLKNPNAAAIGIARQLGGSNVNRIEGLISAAQVGGTSNLLSSALPSLENVKNKVGQLQGVINGFEAECNRLTDPRQLVNIISSLSLYGELSCALGIEGLDIGGGLQVVNENGQLSIQYAVAANVDLEKVLNQIDPGLGTATAGAVESLRSGLDSAFQKLDAANSAIQSVVDLTTAMQNEAADFIQKYTSINSLANLINEANTDPCFKLGSTMNGSLVSPDFLNAVRGGSPTGFGTSAR
jgi:hypothetical protein